MTLHNTLKQHNARIDHKRATTARTILYTALLSSLTTLLAYSYALELTLLK